jgi:Zn-dependent protease
MNSPDTIKNPDLVLIFLKLPAFRLISIFHGLSFFSLFYGVFRRVTFPASFRDRAPRYIGEPGLVATILFFFSVLFHEMSHSLMAQRCGIEISEIKLFIFGGVSRLSEEAKNPVTEFKIAVVGPLSSFVLAVFFWFCHQLLGGLQLPLAQAITGYLVWINVALGIFNLLPGFPLMADVFFEQWYGTQPVLSLVPLKWASDVGKGLAIALMVLGAIQIFTGMLIGGIWLIFIGMFLRGVAEGGYQEVLMRQSLEDAKCAK